MEQHKTIQPIHNQLQWHVRWLALLHDTIAMAVDHGDYDDELIEHALDRIDQQMRVVKIPVVRSCLLYTSDAADE